MNPESSNFTTDLYIASDCIENCKNILTYFYTIKNFKLNWHIYIKFNWNYMLFIFFIFFIFNLGDASNI